MRSLITFRRYDDARQSLMKAQLERIFEQARFKDYVMRFRVKAETYAEETRVRVTCMRMSPLNYATECKNLTKAIDELLAAQS